MGIKGTSPKTARATASNTTTTSVAKKVGNALTADNNRVCSNRGSGEDRGGNSASSTEDRREGRNCYNCGRFGHMARYCRNRGVENRIGEGRRLEYERNEGQRRIEGENGK